MTTAAGGAGHSGTGVIAAAALAAVAAVAGCAGTQADAEQLYAEARGQNLLFKQTLAGVQVHLYDGDWQVQEYGDLPVDCGAGYGFSLSRTTPEGWTLDGDAHADGPTFGAHAVRWLADRGWTTQPVATSDDGTTRVQARNDALHIGSLTIEIRDGAASADSVAVYAATDCYDGDPDELTAILIPGWPDDPVAHEPLPASEPPGAVPVFGFTEDGHPR
ncbi:hypothetical protein [Microbacterium kyungheense]|uniref:Uncharacterized protein n=1 Tax=Microbacterium kyungheense TaxID=1263636 RepID=A0A543EQD5_9MICO|nr:hypothetical protein [Microbacterium kyungheense]TQM23797.1 hypothetical protein FB391_3187 [Microbacterium kyungheense]